MAPNAFVFFSDGTRACVWRRYELVERRAETIIQNMSSLSEAVRGLINRSLPSNDARDHYRLVIEDRTRAIAQS